jgi:hypothetical protein
MITAAGQKGWGAGRAALPTSLRSDTANNKGRTPLADQPAPVAEKTKQGRLTGSRLPAGTAGIRRGIDVGRNGTHCIGALKKVDNRKQQEYHGRDFRNISQ